MRKKIYRGLTLQSIYNYAMGSRDSELEQAGIRVLMGIALLFYFTKAGLQTIQIGPNFHLDLICVLAGFVTISAFVTACIFLRPGDKPVRRTLAILLDTGTLTYLFIIGGSHTAPLYFLFQWIIIGYGFRFGKRYLFIALALSLLGFGTVIWVVPYWRDEIGLSAGLWLGTLLISVYFSTLVGRLYNALNHAEEANRAKRQFICSVSHELRTPLNAIIGMIDLMRSTKVDREQQEMLVSMTTTSQVMLSQIEDVLDFSKIEAGKMSVENIPFDLSQLVQGIIDIFWYQIDPFQIEMSHCIDSQVPYLVSGDPHHLRQILVNLIGNAVKFTEQGRISLGVTRLPSPDEKIWLRFVVRDTGIGIPDSAREKIFDSFTQADESTARRFGGTGLGTTICKQLVELMNGRIGFASQTGKGSEFFFELAFDMPDDVSKKESEEIFSAIRTLIFSADTEPMSLISSLIDKCGVAPVLARTPQLAVNSLEQAMLAGTPIRLIFIDTSRQSGQSVLSYAESIKNYVAYFKKSGNHGRLNIILISADIETAEQISGLMDIAGLYSILRLPVLQEHLVNILHAHLIDLHRSQPRTVIAELPIVNSGAALSLYPANDTGYEILVAEDNATNRKVMQKILERAGHRCTLVKDGDEALDAIDKKSFDALVLDMNMPSVTGTDVARLCRLMHGNSARLPIIMFSANVTPDARQESIEAGADEFLPKPIQVDSFLKTLDRLVGERYGSSVSALKTISGAWPDALVLFRPEESILNLNSLDDLEQVSKDKKFLDDLIVEFIAENKKLLASLEQAMLLSQKEKFKEVVHAIKGSALSVGAVSLKMICKRLEKIDPSLVENYPKEIMQQINQAFGLLCEELEKYRQRRHQRSYEAGD